MTGMFNQAVLFLGEIGCWSLLLILDLMGKKQDNTLSGTFKRWTLDDRAVQGLSFQRSHLRILALNQKLDICVRP